MTSPPVLLVTSDEDLLEDVSRLAAAAGVALEVVHDTTAALRGWSSAAVVLLGADLAARVAEQRPPRRDHLHLVGHAPLPDLVFRAALAVGVVDVVELPGADAWLVELLTDAVDAIGGASAGDSGGSVGRRARTWAVLGGSGGAGATTLACSLALVAAVDRPTTLVDLDPLGAGVDRVVGLEGGAGVRWDGLLSSRGRLGSRSLRAALPVHRGLSVLTWGPGAPADLDPVAVREVLSAAQRGNDVVVLDVPRSLDDPSGEVLTRCDDVLLVVAPTVAGVAAAGKVAGVARRLTDGLSVAVRGRGGVAAEEVAAALGLPLAVELPQQRRLDEHVDLGLGPVHRRRSALTRAVAGLLVASRPARDGAA